MNNEHNIDPDLIIQRLENIEFKLSFKQGGENGKETKTYSLDD